MLLQQDLSRSSRLEQGAQWRIRSCATSLLRSSLQTLPTPPPLQLLSGAVTSTPPPPRPPKLG